MTNDSIVLSLKGIIQLLPEKIEYFFGGSTSLMIQGIEIEPHDIDVVIRREDLVRVSLPKSIGGFDIEIISFENLGQPIVVEFEGMSLPVLPLKEELKFYSGRPGKEEIVKKICSKIGNAKE